LSLKQALRAWTNNRATCALIWRVAGAGSARLRIKQTTPTLGCQTASLSLHVVADSAARAVALSETLEWPSRCLNHCASVALPASCSASSSPSIPAGPAVQDKVPVQGVFCPSATCGRRSKQGTAPGLFTLRAHMPGLIRVGRQK
jgi:hypothetical protein